MFADLESLYLEEDRIKNLLKKGLEEKILQMPNVRFVSVGMKQTEGKAISPSVCIRVYVDKKVKKEAMRQEDLIPETIEGIPTDVNVLDYDFQFSDDTAKYRPIVGGIQITNGILDLNDQLAPEMYSGTLGCLGKHNGKIVALTNWHVVSRSGGKIGSKVYQARPPILPAAPDIFPAKPTSDEDKIGTIENLLINDKVDCAIIKITEPCKCLCCECCGLDYSNQIHNLNMNGDNFIHGVEGAHANMKVVKVGKKTGKTEGVIIDTQFPSLTISRDGTNYTFLKQIKIEHKDGATKQFSHSGDSGSVIINIANSHIVGLLFSDGTKQVNGQPHYATFANHITDVTSALGMSINVKETARGIADAPSFIGETPMSAVAFSSSNNILTHQGRQQILFSERDEWLKTRTGKRFSQLFERHRAEVFNLINYNTEVSMTWHRNRGPSLIALLVRFIEAQNQPFPDTINGRPYKTCIQNLATIFRRFGSTDLLKDLKKCENLVGRLEGMTYEAFKRQKAK